MTFTYRILAPGLHDTANSAIGWFIQQWGLKKSKISVEMAFHAEVNYRPTFVVPLDDGHIFCLDVSASIYSNTLDSVVLDCLHKALPVKLVVAAPKGKDPDYASKLKSAKRAGVGILEVDGKTGVIIQVPVPLSLAGLRPFRAETFPKRYRQPLQHADQMFRDGEPSKACSLIYDELEAACRNLAKKCANKGLWNPGRLKLDTDAWATIMNSLDNGLDRSNPTAKKFTSSLLARIIGVTAHRNDSGHKPKNLNQRMKRDQELRTRFEGGVDLLREVLEAAKGLGPI
jgi:hypothetical protein